MYSYFGAYFFSTKISDLKIILIGGVVKLDEWNALRFKKEITENTSGVRNIIAIATKYVKLDIPIDFVDWVENVDKNCLSNPKIWIGSKQRHGSWESYIYCLDNMSSANPFIRGEQMASVWCAILGSDNQIINLPSGWTVVNRELVRL